MKCIGATTKTIGQTLEQIVKLADRASLAVHMKGMSQGLRYGMPSRATFTNRRGPMRHYSFL